MSTRLPPIEGFTDAPEDDADGEGGPEHAGTASGTERRRRRARPRGRRRHPARPPAPRGGQRHPRTRTRSATAWRLDGDRWRQKRRAGGAQMLEEDEVDPLDLFGWNEAQPERGPRGSRGHLRWRPLPGGAAHGQPLGRWTVMTRMSSAPWSSPARPSTWEAPPAPTTDGTITVIASTEDLDRYNSRFTGGGWPPTAATRSSCTSTAAAPGTRTPTRLGLARRCTWTTSRACWAI